MALTAAEVNGKGEGALDEIFDDSNLGDALQFSTFQDSEVALIDYCYYKNQIGYPTAS